MTSVESILNRHRQTPHLPDIHVGALCWRITSLLTNLDGYTISYTLCRALIWVRVSGTLKYHLLEFSSLDSVTTTLFPEQSPTEAQDEPFWNPGKLICAQSHNLDVPKTHYTLEIIWSLKKILQFSSINFRVQVRLAVAAMLPTEHTILIN